MEEQVQQTDVVAEVFSPQLKQKIAIPENRAQMALPAAPPPASVRRPPRPVTDTLFRWNALPNEFIVPIGRTGAKPHLGGSVSKLFARGVLRFPSSIQRIRFRTDNISSENQGVMVEGWACWRVSDPELAVQKLDFSDLGDPMGKTAQTLAIQCAGIMKGLISIKDVAQLLKRREDLIDQLHDKLVPTEERWGISFDEIGISEVQVLSQDVFENLQRPYRNEAREVAATSDLETEERIAAKTAEQQQKVTLIESERDRNLRELKARSETEVRTVELAEESKRVRAEQELTDLRLEEDKRVKAMSARLERELQQEVAKADEEVVRARAQLAVAEREADAQARRAEVTLEGELERARVALHTEAEEARLRLAAQEREVAGRYSDAEIRMRVVQSLPEIASRIQLGDVRWYGGESGGPPGLLGRALDEVLDVARAHGLELGRLAESPPAE